MTECFVQASGTIELYFYGELMPAERDALELHLKSCGECRGALEELSVIRAALAGRPVVAAPPGGDWSGFMSRLDQAIAAEATPEIAAPVVEPAPSSRRYMGYLAMAALIALVTISVLLVARGRRDLPASPAAVAANGAAGAQGSDGADDAAFAAVSEQHFERSKLVVLGLTTKDAHATAADWTYERELASSLLTDTRMYRQAAEARGMSTVAGIMRDLELVLLQTSLTDDRDPAALGQIQRLIRKRDLLEKMDVMTTAGL